MNLLPDCNFLLGTGRFSFKTALGVEMVAVVVIVEVVVVVVVAVVVVVEVEAVKFPLVIRKEVRFSNL